MKSIILTILLIAGVSFANSQDEIDTKMIRLLTHTNADGSKLLYEVSPNRVEKSPVWDGTGLPPLTMLDAISLSEAWVNGQHPEWTDANLNTLTLHSIYKNRWVYKITLEMKEKVGLGFKYHRITSLVLFDGTIVEPERIKGEGIPPKLFEEE
jgi:hypothetical protein